LSLISTLFVLIQRAGYKEKGGPSLIYRNKPPLLGFGLAGRLRQVGLP
jgi:hypothetical protein